MHDGAQHSTAASQILTRAKASSSNRDDSDEGSSEEDDDDEEESESDEQVDWTDNEYGEDEEARLHSEEEKEQSNDDEEEASKKEEETNLEIINRKTERRGRDVYRQLNTRRTPSPEAQSTRRADKSVLHRSTSAILSKQSQAQVPMISKSPQTNTRERRQRRLPSKYRDDSFQQLNPATYSRASSIGGRSRKASTREEEEEKERREDA